MPQHSRFAVYYMPEPGPLADFGASWLGWDAQSGKAVSQPDDVAALTDAPRKYGFHGTLKPPFRLADGTSSHDLAAALAKVAARTAPARADGLALTRLGRFLALTPAGDSTEIMRVAAACVTELDRFRAPASAAELDRRRGSGLSDRHEALLLQWGYPYVLDQFRFHLTLTSKVAKAKLDTVEGMVRDAMPPLPKPFDIHDVCLCGERADGRFELIQRFALKG